MAAHTRSIVYRPASAPPKVQIVRVNSPKPVKRRGRGSRSKGRGGGGASMAMVAGGGIVLGLLEKADLGLPTIPVLGKKGTLALGLWFIARQTGSPLARDLAMGMAAVSAYELGKEGSISGY